MKIVKRLTIAILIVFSLASLSSCAFFERALNKLGLGGGATESSSVEPSRSYVEPSKSNDEPTPSSDVFVPSTNVSTPSIGASSSIAQASSSSEIREVPLDYGYSDLARFANRTSYQGLYTKFKNSLESFYNSTRSITGQSLTVNGETSTYYIIDDVDYTEYNITDTEAFAVLKSVLLDNPKYYFVSNRLLCYSSTSGFKKTEYIKVTADDDYASYSARALYNSKISEFETNCYAGLTTDMTDLEKVKHVHDYIVSHATYAYELDGVTPSTKSISHNMVGIAYEGKGVCESYSELFTYLLKKIDIPALTVSGLGYTSTSLSGENHAWNYVYIEGEYYGFDVTWDDSTHSYDYYGMSYSSIVNGRKSYNGSHVASDSRISDGVNYLYRIPSASPTDIIIA